MPLRLTGISIKIVNKVKNYKYGEEEDTDTKKNCYSYLRHLTEKDKGITIIIQRKETLKSILRIKFSLRKHLWKLSVGKDRNVLRFTNTLFINSHDPSHMLE